jgi:5-methylcytosine-specific restriction enzyme subunit McrC
VNDIVVREYAKLTTEPGYEGMDCHSVSQEIFRFLREFAARFSKSGVPLVHWEGGTSLRLDNYVGVIQLPDGAVLEIVPKHTPDVVDVESARAVLIKMLGAVTDMRPRTADVSEIALLKRPLHEWVMSRFLQEFDVLVKRGLKFDYREIEEERPFVRGRIDVAQQMRQSPGRLHLVHVRHEEFMPDCAGNRLLRSALRRIRLATRDPGNWRLANELSSRTEEIAASSNTLLDMKKWRTGRLLARYAAIRPWCELVLGTMMPMAQRGSWEGLSMLFPMDVLFEKYVALRLEQQLQPSFQLKRQSTLHSLCEHDGGWMFQLAPDLLVRGDESCWVLDTKWKLIDESNRNEKYLIGQADVYQMFAYSHRYVEGNGQLFLVYPRSPKFQFALPEFTFRRSLRLHVVPFDLEHDRLLTDAAPFLAVAGRSATAVMKA